MVVAQAVGLQSRQAKESNAEHEKRNEYLQQREAPRTSDSTTPTLHPGPGKSPFHVQLPRVVLICPEAVTVTQRVLAPEASAWSSWNVRGATISTLPMG